MPSERTLVMENKEIHNDKTIDCFESVRLIQRYYSRTGIFQMDYLITYKLAFSPD